jgi:hypothetical protein
MNHWGVSCMQEKVKQKIVGMVALVLVAKMTKQRTGITCLPAFDATDQSPVLLRQNHTATPTSIDMVPHVVLLRNVSEFLKRVVTPCDRGPSG